VVDLQSVRAEWGVGEPDVPVDLVAAEEGEVDTAVAGGGGGGTHGGRPVLVVPEGDHRAGAVEEVRVGVQIDVGGVAQRDPGGLGHADRAQVEQPGLGGAAAATTLCA